MTKREKSDRERLLEARASIQRQIEILEAGPVMETRGGIDFGSPLAELEATLAEIETSLSQLEADDADKK